MSDPFIGEVRMFGGNFAPRNWALCDGQLLAISQNTALFSLLGTTYGGDGTTTFALPDLRGRVPIHAGSGPGLTPRNLGVKVGTEYEYLNITQVAHTHNILSYSNTGGSNSPSGNYFAKSSVAGRAVNSYHTTDNNGIPKLLTNFSGGSQPHNNMQPFQCVNFIIALQGIYPSRN